MPLLVMRVRNSDDQNVARNVISEKKLRNSVNYYSILIYPKSYTDRRRIIDKRTEFFHLQI